MDIQKISDEKLVVLTREKDSELYGEIVKRYQDKLLRYVRRLTNNSPDSEDVVQNSFIKAYKNLYEFDPRRKFSSWIFRIAHNESINFIKKYNREILAGDRDYLFEIESHKKTPGEHLDAKINAEKLQEGIGNLPIKYKDILVLFYLEDKNYSEISDILRLPMGTVATRLNRGKKLLKTICINNGIGHEKE